MNIESVREYCLSLPLVTEDFPFDERTLAFRILGKIFACVDLERPEWVTMKCNADYVQSKMLHIERFQVNMLQENCYVVSDDTLECVIIDCGAFYLIL